MHAILVKAFIHAPLSNSRDVESLRRRRPCNLSGTMLNVLEVGLALENQELGVSIQRDPAQPAF